MSNPDTRDPSIFPIPGYGRLLRPAAMPRLDELFASLSQEQEELRAALSLIKHHLSMVDAIIEVGAQFGERLRDGSYAQVIFSCGVIIKGVPYQVRMIIRFDDPSKSGLCYAERDVDPEPLCTLRFDALVNVFIEALQEVVGSNA